MAVNVQIDASKVGNQLDAFTKAVKASGAVVGEFRVKSLEFNEAGKVTVGIIEQMTAAGGKLATTFDVAGNSASLNSAKMTTGLKAAADEMARLQGLAGKSGGDQARGLFPLPPDAAISKIVSYNSAINNLQQAIGAAGLSAGQLTQMFTQAANSPAQFAQGLAGLTPQLQAVGNAILAVGAQAQTAGAVGAKAGQTFGISWQGLVRIFEAQIFRRAISGLIDGMKQGATAALDFQIQLAQVGNITQNTGERLQGFGAQVRALSEQFAVPIGEALGAAQIALTGQLNNSAAGFNVLTNAMRLSQATGTELAAATRLITTSLQAFRLEGDQAARVTNVLYNAAQRSRVPLEEMQAAIGRVSQTAHGLGVSFEQTTALFLTIQQQGGRPTEAFSLLNQVMGRLLQPTKELQQVIQGLGYSSAAAGIQIAGLPGFLNQLSEVASRSPGALGDLSGSLRTMKALMATTGDQVKVFEENLRNLGQTNVLDGAANVAQTNAQRIRVAFNELKNVFTIDIGQALINNLVTIADKLGGAKATVAAFTEVLKGMVVVFVTFKAAVAIATLIDSYTIAIRGATAATATMGTTKTTAAASANIFAAVFAIAFAAGNLYFANEKANEAALEANIRARIRSLNEAIERQTQANNLAAGRRSETAQRFATAQFQPELQASAQRLIQYQREREAAVDVHHASQDAFHTANQAILDGLREQLSQTRRQREEARAGIEQSTKSQQDFTQSVRAQSFQRTLGLNTDPARGIQLLQQRRSQNQAEIEGIQRNANATREQIERARQLFEENKRITAEINERDVALQRIRNAQNNNYETTVRNGVRVRVEHISEAAALQRENQLIQERARFEEAIRVTLARQQETARTTQIGEQLRLRTLEAAVRRSEQFNPFGADGNLAERFTRGGRTQEQATQAALAEARAKKEQVLLTARNALGADWNKQGTEAQRIYAELERTENDRLRTIEAEIRAAGRVSREMEGQQRTQAQIAELAQRTQSQTQAANNARNAIAQGAGPVGATVTRAQSALTALPEIGGLQIAASSQAELDAARAVRTEYAQLRNALDDVARAQRNLTEAQTPENVRAVAAAVETLRLRQNGLVETLNDPARRRAVADAGFSEAQLQGIRNLSSTGLVQLQTSVNGLNRSLAELTQANQNIANITRNSTGAAAGVAAELLAGVDTVIQRAPDFIGVFQGANNAADDLAANLAEIDRVIREMPPIPVAPQPGVAPGPNPQDSWMGGLVGYRAGGGLTGFHPGRPRGTDTLPYWLSPGEFVVNAHSTGKFYSQLLSINSGHQPKYAAAGGPVSVGDINVHVNGGTTSEKTIREIGNGINREIRRGTIRWRT